MLFSHKHAVGDNKITNVSTRVRSQMLPIRVCIRFGTVNGCAPPTVSNGAATTREGRMKPHAHRENHTARSQTVDAQVCINKMHDKRHLSTHDASNHTMNTTGTCNPQKLRWHVFTWKPSTTGEHPTPTNNRYVTIPQVRHKRHAHENISVQRARTSRAISCVWGDTSLLPMKYARCPRHIARATCDTCDKQKDSGNTSPKTSIHHLTRAPQQDVSELVLLVQSWPRAARRKTQRTETDDTNDARGHHTQNITAPHRVKQLESFDATRSTM